MVDESCNILANKQRRMDQSKTSLFTTPPTSEERELIHNMFITAGDVSTLSFEPKVLPDNHVWMNDTKLKNLIICHPEVILTHSVYASVNCPLC